MQQVPDLFGLMFLVANQTGSQIAPCCLIFIKQVILRPSVSGVWIFCDTTYLYIDLMPKSEKGGKSSVHNL